MYQSAQSVASTLSLEVGYLCRQKRTYFVIISLTRRRKTAGKVAGQGRVKVVVQGSSPGNNGFPPSRE